MTTNAGPTDSGPMEVITYALFLITLEWRCADVGCRPMPEETNVPPTFFGHKVEPPRSRYPIFTRISVPAREFFFF
jgi:hypothetical protein